MANKTSRRNFLRTAPVAAAIGLTLTDKLLLAQGADAALASPTPATENFKLFTAQQLEDDAKALEAKPGNNNLEGTKTFTIAMTTEVAKSAKEFEWHAGRDHMIQILDGETVYEVGGSPKNGREIRTGEWLAPESEGATKLTLKKGDMLTIERGTLHKRSTAGSVTFILISPM